MSFATGTSWGTMALLFPLAVPLAFSLSNDEQFWVTNIFCVQSLLFAKVNCISSILAGSIVGDHASPISGNLYSLSQIDTTITASLACSISVDDHVRTQLPYVIFVALFSIVFGTLPTGLGVSPWVVLPVGYLAMSAIVWLAFPSIEESGEFVLLFLKIQFLH